MSRPRSNSPSPPRPSSPPPATPFLLNLHHRKGSFHRQEELLHPTVPPASLYAFKTTTLIQLVHLLADAHPSALPSPAIGTRVAFRLSFSPDARAGRLTTKDLGSVVIRGRNRSIDTGMDDDDDDPEDADDSDKTLHDAKFIVGDYLSCAILPPDEVTGETRSAVGLYSSAAAAAGGEGAAGGGFPRGGRDGVDGRRREEFGGAGRRGGGGFRGRGSGFGAGRGEPLPGWGFRGRGGFGDRDGGGFPGGEWRRGENLPAPPSRGRFVGRGTR
ncbi:Sin3 associated polypeptide p18-domain-containing protein [Podospora conica]|nr:Sin3 associated polypeptide p18-domain-containing protein [Schizothecium conicum]